MAIDLTKYGTPVTNKSSTIDFSKYGTPIDAPTTPQEEGFFKSVYKSIASPVFNMIARPGQAVQALTGNEVSTGKFLGVDITAPQTGKDVLKDVGAGLETVALGIGGGGTANVIRQGFKEGIKTGIKEGAMVGLKSSPIYGAGASLSGGETDIRTILKDASIATAVGVPTSAVLGGITPAIVGGAKKFTQQGLRDELGSIYRETASRYTKAQTVLDQSTQVHKTDPVAVLQMYGKHTIPDMAGGGADTKEPVEFLKKKIGELSGLKKEALFLSDEKVPLGGYKKYTEELVDAQNWSNVKKAKVKKDLNKIFADFDQAYKQNPDLELIELDKLKTEQTGKSKSYNNPNSPFDYDSHAIAGKGARDLIELLTDNQEIKDLNKLIQGHYDAIDLMDALNGKKIHGGALSKMFFKLGGDIVGATAGSTVGSPIVGAVAGHVISGKIADIVQNKFITNPVKRLLINQLKEQSPKEVNAVLKSLETKYKTIFDDLFPEGIPKTLKQTPVKTAPKVNQATDINLGNQSLEKSQSSPSPITKPITTASKIAIPETIPPKANKSIPNKQGGFSKIGLLASATGATAIGATQIDEAKKETSTPIVQAETPKTPEDKATANAEKKYGIKFPKGFLKAVREQESSNKDNPKNLRLSMGLTDSAMKELGKDALPNTSIENVMQNSANYLALKSKLKKADGKVIDLTTPENQIKWYVQRYVGLLPGESRMINGEKVSYDKIYKSFEKLLAKYQ